MKKLTTLFIVIVLFSGNFEIISARDREKQKDNQENTVSSLLAGLKSDNKGLRSSSAYMLGELNVSSAVIPLMRILRNDNES